MKRILFNAFVMMLAVAFLFPFYWMLVSSFRNNSEIFSTKIVLLPRHVGIENYRDLGQKTNFLRWMMNSILVTLSTTALGLFFSVFAGFALAKYRFPLSNMLLFLILLLVAIPRFVTVIPIYKLMSTIKLTNTYFALILPFAVNPFAVFLMRQYMRSVPDEVLDSVRIDGGNELQIVLRVVIPVVRPAIGAAAMFISMMTWNDYLFPLILMSKGSMTLFTVGLTSLKSLFVVEYGMIMAGSLLSTLPLIVLLLQKQFILGLTEGAVKG